MGADFDDRKKHEVRSDADRLRDLDWCEVRALAELNYRINQSGSSDVERAARAVAHLAAARRMIEGAQISMGDNGPETVTPAPDAPRDPDS